MASHHFYPTSTEENNNSEVGQSVQSQTEPITKTELPPTSLSEGHSLQSATADETSTQLGPPLAAQPSIIVAIDFGTTYSGVAHAFSTSGEFKTDNIQLIQSWPGSNQTSEKVPTRFSYINNEERPTKSVKSSKHQTAASDIIFRWGYDMEPGDPDIRFIKLLLEPEKELPEHARRDDIEGELKKHGKTLIQAVADYLRKLREEADQSLESRYGASRVNGTPRRTVLTIPAIWSDAAKEATKQAAILAGFSDNVLLVGEPEAAAIWTLRTSSSLEPKVGDIFVVVDAGGGTCDLISYEITQLSPLRVKEAVAGSGGLCGASFVNQRFKQRMSDKIGQTSFEEFIKQNPTNWHVAEKDFEENPKRNFDPQKRDRQFHVLCPGIKDNAKLGIKRGRIALSTENLREIFAPIITEIVDLVTKQVDSLNMEHKHPTAILLVGGFGTSKYVYENVKNQFRPRHIEVLQPADAWGAVVKGAVLYASEAQYMVQSRKSRYNYGVKYYEVFDPELHPLKSKFWDELEEQWMSGNRFECYIKRGESVSVMDPICHRFYTSFEPHETRREESRLLASPASTPPSSSDDALLKTVCTLNTDLSKVPEHSWKKKTNSNGKNFVTLDYDMKIRLESGGLKFWIEIDGVEYSAITASFESI